MMRRACIAAAALALVFSSAANARIIRPDGGDISWYERELQRAKVPPPRGDFLLVFENRCPAHGEACANRGPPPWIDLTHPDRRFMREPFLHEVGHVFDFTTLHDGHRRFFQRLTGDRRPWFGPSAKPWDTPAEHFADAYYYCALNPWRVPQSYVGVFAGATAKPLTRTVHRRHRRACRMIRHAGGWLTASERIATRADSAPARSGRRNPRLADRGGHRDSA